MMSKIFFLMSKIKAQAITCFKLLLGSLTADFNFNINDQNMRDNDNCEFDEKKVQEIESFSGRISPTLNMLKHKKNQN